MVQPRPAQVIVGQPPTIIIKTQPLVCVIGPSGINETIVGLDRSAIVGNATGREVSGTSMSTNEIITTAITDDNSTTGSGQLYIDVRELSVANNRITIGQVSSNAPAWVIIYPNLRNTPDSSHYLGWAMLTSTAASLRAWLYL